MSSHLFQLNKKIVSFVAGFICCILLLESQQTLHAQILSNSTRIRQADGSTVFTNQTDTSKKKQVKTDDRIIIYYFTYHDSSAKKTDSSIGFLHHSPILNQWEHDLGNFASAAKSIYFQPELGPENKFGMTSNQSFRKNINGIKFYNTTRPYTDLYYRLGSKLEQIISVLHSRNINPALNITAAYAKEGSAGQYLLQRTNNDHLTISSNYQSVNQRYKMLTAFCYNKIQQDENGGIESEEYLNYTDYNNKRLVPVVLDEISGERRSNMTNYYRDVSIELKHDYFFGVKDSVLTADSSERIYTFKPVFGIRHRMYASNSIQRFKDRTPDSLYYTFVGNYSFGSKDSVYSKGLFSQFGNAFSLNGNIRFHDHVMSAEAGYGIEFDHYKRLQTDQQYINNYLFAAILKPAVGSKEWLYDAALKFYFTGNLLGNTLLSAKAGKKLSKSLGEITIGFDQTIQNPTFTDASFNTNFYSLNSKLNKQTITRVNASYNNEKLHSTISFNYYMLANFIYRDTTLFARQAASIIPINQLNISNRLRFKRFVFDNQILLQILSSKAPLHLPLFASRSRWAYENIILKKKLIVASGVDFKYNTPFYTDQYAPLMYSFVTQSTRKIENIPQVSYFFNFRVKSFRASISFDELQQLFTRNNINYSMYPAQNFMMHFGFHWTFVN